MGIDHTRLTYRYAGRDFRLTDVDGNVMREILSSRVPECHSIRISIFSPRVLPQWKRGHS